MERLELPVEDLLLDLSNPRLVEVETQADAMKALVGLGLPYFKNLMASIRENGLDPGDAFYVLQDETDEGSFIVVDGNRRLAALKVLNEASVLRSLDLTDSELKLLTAAVSGYKPGTIDKVDCVLFDSRKEADDWILRRHGNDLEGEGRLKWGKLEIDRFQRDHTNLDVIQFVERNTSLPGDEWSEVKKAVENNSSSLDRFLNNKALRKLLGLTVTTEVDDSKIPYFTAEPGNTIKVLERIFSDIHNKKINTRNYNKAEDVELYIEQLPADLKSGSASDKPQRFRDVQMRSTKDKEAETKKGEKEQSKTSRAAKPRATLAEKRHAFQQPTTTKGQRFVFEASRLRTADYPLASASVLRGFLEHTVDVYMQENKLPRQDGKGKVLELHRRASAVIDHLIKEKKVTTGQALRGAERVLTDTKSASSIQALNDYHHARYEIPAADALRVTWDACIPLSDAISILETASEGPACPSSTPRFPRSRSRRRRPGESR